MPIGEPKPGVLYDPLDSKQGRLSVRRYTLEATGEVVDDMFKRGKTGQWQLLCDETAQTGGRELAPAPLHYFASAVLFSEMTQIARYANLMRVPIKSVKGKVTVNLYFTGSVQAQRVDAGGEHIDTTFEIESDAPLDQVRAVLSVARQGAWIRQMLLKPTPFQDTLLVNGEKFEL